MSKTCPLTTEQVKGIRDGSITQFRIPIEDFEEVVDISWEPQKDNFPKMKQSYRYKIKLPYQQGDIVNGPEKFSHITFEITEVRVQKGELVYGIKLLENI